MNLFAKRSAPTAEVSRVDAPAFLRAVTPGMDLLPPAPPRRPDPLSPRAASLMSEVVLKSAEAFVDTMVAEALRYKNEAEAYYNETVEWGNRELELARERAADLASKHACMRDARDRFLQVPGVVPTAPMATSDNANVAESEKWTAIAVAAGWTYDEPSGKYRLNDTGEAYEAEAPGHLTWRALCEQEGLDEQHSEG